MTKHKLSLDLCWNYISIAVTAVCGATFSIIISCFYPESILGRFNIVYSYYIVMSQFCVCGIHIAIVKYTAERRDEATGLLIKAVAITTMVSCAMSAFFYYMINILLGARLGESMVSSFNIVIPSLVLFSINKVFLGWMNGMMFMKAYAFFQAIRNVTIALGLLAFSLIKLQGEKLLYCFFVAEIVVLLLSMLYLCYIRKQINHNETSVTSKELLSFGLRILPSNAVLELNTKIDVICLAFVLNNESLVGVYSFAAMFAEGFYQLMIVLRKVLNPYIAVKHTKGILAQYIDEFRKDYLKKIYVIFGVAYGLIIVFYYFVVAIIGNERYYYGTVALVIICLGMLFNTKSIVFGNVLAQTGNPGSESTVNIISTGANAVLNLILIYYWGVAGAAIATGISYFVYSVLQNRFLKSRTGIML